MINFQKLLIPGLDVVCPLLFVFVIFGWWGIILMVDCPVYYLHNNRVGGKEGGGGRGEEGGGREERKRERGTERREEKGDRK